MKKINLFAYVCLVALVSAGLSSCKNENEPQRVPSVSTDIAMSLPGQLGGARRMPGATVQTNPVADFAVNGMKNVTLIPFAKGPVTSTSTRLGDNLALGLLSSAAKTSSHGNGRSQVFVDQQVPVGTSAFLFYGESNVTGATKFHTGSLNYSLTDQPADFTFALEPLVVNVSDVENHAAYKGLIKFLNAVANAEDMDPEDEDYATKKKAWKEYTALDNEGMYELFQTFSQTTYLNSFGIRRMMEDLYKTLKPMQSTSKLAKHICDTISDGTYGTVAADVVTLESTLQNFPTSLNLPEGSLAVAYDSDAKTFGGNAAHAFGDLQPATIDRYVYPAALMYYTNSKIKTSTSPKLDNYEDAASWLSILNTYEKNDGSVNSKTRSIAIKDTVQYAVARLDVQVKIGGEGVYLEDNNPVTTENHIVNPTGGYTLTAVLVGGQKNVGFDFTPKGSTAYTIYDKEMSGSIAAEFGSFSAANSTLVLETAANESQFIAIELVNTTGEDFYGVEECLVPAGGKFYLVGELKADNRTSSERTEGKVFKQDFTTTAKLTIGNLKKAYNTLPDLRAPELEVGLSVDLNWQEGNVYEVTL